MELERNPGPLLGLCACDADLFRRVWERVEPEPRPDCPVAPIPAAPDLTLDILTPDVQTPPPAQAPVSPPAPEAWAVPEAAAQSAPEAVPEPPAGAETPPMPVPAPEAVPEAAQPGEQMEGDDFPGEDDLPCLGSGSAAQGGALQGYIRQELESWQLYRHLARKINGPNARVLSALASEKHRRARRLAAAYFLISGVRFWPTDQLAVPRLNSWLGVLRERFSTEQRQEHRYRAAACGTCDPCLAELYGELAAESAAHGAALRAILETAL